MDAEILFFMTEKDEADFLTFAEKNLDSIDKGNDVYSLVVGDCELLFTPSMLQGLCLYTGKLEIRLGNADVSFKDLERAKSTFRKLRNWMKKKYWSRLSYLNKDKKDKLTPSRNHWLAPDAKGWKVGDRENRILKLSSTSWMVFEIGV